MKGEASLVLWAEMEDLVRKAVTRFGIPRRTRLTALRKTYRPKRLGDAGKPHNVIRLRVHHHGNPARALRPSVVLATLAHEIAHLVPRSYNHGPTHRKRTKEVAEWLREKGYDVSPRLQRGWFPRKRR